MAKVLDKGELALVELMGSDQSVVRAARISNGAVMPEWRGAADEKLIRFLAENRHMTPFEHVVATFYVKAPIFVIREWQRHRTFSYNERSGRYKEFEEEFYLPDSWRVPNPKNKQSSIESEDVDHAYVQGLYLTSVRASFREYKGLLNAGVAREMARMVLPLSTYTEMYVTGNLRNWMHFIDLRLSSDAQFEIRAFADEVDRLIAGEVPISWNALKGPA